MSGTPFYVKCPGNCNFELLEHVHLKYFDDKQYVWMESIIPKTSVPLEKIVHDCRTGGFCCFPVDSKLIKESDFDKIIEIKDSNSPEFDGIKNDK